MKRLLLLLTLFVLLMAVTLLSATKDVDNLIATAVNSSITIDSQHTDYGDWVRVCSVGRIDPILDSGFIVLEVTGTATLPRGATLYVGIDSSGGTTDTLYGYTKVEVTNSARTAYTEIPFSYVFRSAVFDSNLVDSVPFNVVTMATGGTTQPITVKHVVLQQLFDYLGD